MRVGLDEGAEGLRCCRLPVFEIPEIDCASLKRLLDRSRRDLARPIMVFDADGTLWSGDVGLDMFTAAIARRALRDEARQALAQEAELAGLSVEGDANALAERLLDAFAEAKYDEARACAMMAWAFAGFGVDEMEDFARAVIVRESLEDRIVAVVREVIEWASTEGIEVVVCSASPRSVVVAGAALLGIAADHVLGAEPEVANGRLLPKLAGVGLPFAEGKVRALAEARPNRPLLGAFGDSAADAHFMRLSRVPVGVGPHPKLLEAAASIPGLCVLRVG